MKDKELRKDFEDLKERLVKAKVVEKGGFKFSLYNSHLDLGDLVEELRGENLIKGTGMAGYFDRVSHKQLVKKVEDLENKLNIALELLNIEKTTHAKRGLKKGKKEIEY